jgi:hypothetical protein
VGGFCSSLDIIALQVVLAVLRAGVRCLHKNSTAASGQRAVLSALATVVILLSLPNMRIKKHYEFFGSAAIGSFNAHANFLQHLDMTAAKAGRTE